MDPEVISSEEMKMENFPTNVHQQISQFLHKFMFLRTSYEGTTMSIKICRKKEENEDLDSIKALGSESSKVINSNR